jgi:hypothetical protein
MSDDPAVTFQCGGREEEVVKSLLKLEEESPVSDGQDAGDIVVS